MNNTDGPSDVISMQSRVARNQLEKRLADMASSGGLSYDRVGLELLYLLPQDFADVYVEVFHAALAGADGGAGARGEAQAQASGTMRASGKARNDSKGRGDTGGARGRAHGRAARSTGRKYRKIFIVRSEKAFRVKERADKRLRQLAREMRLQLTERDESEWKARSRRACPTCKQFTNIEWRFCPTCGTNLED